MATVGPPTSRDLGRKGGRWGWWGGAAGRVQENANGSKITRINHLRTTIIISAGRAHRRPVRWSACHCARGRQAARLEEKQGASDAHSFRAWVVMARWCRDRDRDRDRDGDALVLYSSTPTGNSVKKVCLERARCDEDLPRATRLFSLTVCCRSVLDGRRKHVPWRGGRCKAAGGDPSLRT